MTGYQVEFFDDTVPTPGEPIPTVPSGRRPLTPILLIAPTLWFSAAALCALAGTRVVWTYSFVGATIQSRGGYDAWGRALDHSLSGDHGPRYAVVLWLCAAVFALLATVVLRGAATPATRWLQQHATGAGIAVAALLTGVLASIGLSLQSTFETYRALGLSVNDAHGSVNLQIGGCVWCGLAALVSAIAAELVHARVRLAYHLVHGSV